MSIQRHKTFEYALNEEQTFLTKQDVYCIIYNKDDHEYTIIGHAIGLYEAEIITRWGNSITEEEMCTPYHRGFGLLRYDEHKGLFFRNDEDEFNVLQESFNEFLERQRGNTGYLGLDYDGYWDDDDDD
jgi:hypothetical protein